MGCDIHMHVEVKLKGSDEWQHLNNPYVGRYYNLFALMAGVRNDGSITPLAEPRGLPSDMSAVTKWDAENWEDDMHSASWLDRKEIGKLQKWWEKQEDKHKECLWFETEIMGNYLACDSYTGKLPRGVEDVRLVFWFDS